MGTMRWFPQGKFASFNELQEVLARPVPASDELVADIFGRFLPSFSLLWSAGYLLGAAGLVCYHRPHLAERVLFRPIECLFYLGARRADHILCWVDSRLPECIDAAETGSESILDAPRSTFNDFGWFRPWPFNPNVCLNTLFRNMVTASGADAEGFEWLKNNLPRHREFIQTALDQLMSECENHHSEGE
jgi:hypothetical protein